MRYCNDYVITHDSQQREGISAGGNNKLNKYIIFEELLRQWSGIYGITNSWRRRENSECSFDVIA